MTVRRPGRVALGNDINTISKTGGFGLRRAVDGLMDVLMDTPMGMGPMYSPSDQWRVLIVPKQVLPDRPDHQVFMGPNPHAPPPANGGPRAQKIQPDHIYIENKCLR